MSSEERYAVASVIGSTGAMHVWHSIDGNPRRVATGATIPGNSALTSLFNGARLLSLLRSKGGGTTIATYETSRSAGGPAARCGAPETSLTTIAASHGHAFVAAGGSSGRVYLWAAGCGTLLAAFDAHLTGVTCLAFTSDDSLLLSAGDDGAVHAWCTSSLTDLSRNRSHAVKPRTSLRGHSLPIRALAVGFGAGSARVVTASVDRSARVWHLGTGLQVGHIVLPSAPVAASLSPDETDMFVGLECGDVYVARLSSLPADIPHCCSGLPCLCPPQGEEPVAVSAMCLSPSGTELIVGYSDGLIRIYDTASKVLVRSYAKHIGGAPVSALTILFPVPDTLLDAAHSASALTGDVGTEKPRSAIIDIPAIASEYAALAAAAQPPPVFAKIEHAGESVEYSSLVSFYATTDPVAEVWEAIDEIAEIELSEGRGGDKRIGGKGGVQGQASDVPVQILEELEMLRKRNKQLEETGQRLCDMMDASTQWAA